VSTRTGGVPPPGRGTDGAGRGRPPDPETPRGPRGLRRVSFRTWGVSTSFANPGATIPTHPDAGAGASGRLRNDVRRVQNGSGRSRKTSGASETSPGASQTAPARPKTLWARPERFPGVRNDFRSIRNGFRSIRNNFFDVRNGFRRRQKTLAASGTVFPGPRAASDAPKVVPERPERLRMLPKCFPRAKNSFRAPAMPPPG